MLQSATSSLPTGGSLSTTVTRLNSDFTRPRVQDYTIGVQQQLPLGFVMSASYAHTYGDHLEIVMDSNLPASTFERTYRLPDGTTFAVPYSAGPSSNVNLARPNPAEPALVVPM